MRSTWIPRSLLFTVIVLMGALSTTMAQLGPGPEHEKLKELVGEWDCTVKMQGMESKGTAVYKLDMHGMWLVSEFSSDFGGQPFKGMGIDGYDASKKKYVGMWVDSMSSSPMMSEGSYDSTGKIMTMVGESTTPDGKKSKNKMVSEMKSPDLMVFNMYMVSDNGSDIPMLTIEYRRKK